jgi:hypothetical protein
MCTCMHVYLHIRHTCVRFQKTAHIPSKEIGDNMYVCVYIYNAVYICVYICSFFRFQKTAKNCYIRSKEIGDHIYIYIDNIYKYVSIYI